MKVFNSFGEAFTGLSGSEVVVHNKVHPFTASVGRVFSELDAEKDDKGNYLLLTIYGGCFGGDAIPDVERCLDGACSKFGIEATKKDGYDYYGDRALTVEEANALSDELSKIFKR